jgi:hypothetical protein
MDLRLELRRTSKLVVASPKGDLVSIAFLSPGTPVPGSGFFRPFRDWFAEKIWLWRPLNGTWFPLLSFPGTPVPGSGFFRPFRDWFAEKIWLWPLNGTWFPLLSFPGTPVPGSGFFRPFRDWFAEKIWLWRPLNGTWFPLLSFPRHSRAGLWILSSLPGLVCGKDLWSDGTGTLLDAINKRPTLQV